MAGDWIKIRKDLVYDPDVVNIAADCNIDEFSVVGRLVAIWSWLDTHSVDGRRVRITDPFLDRLSGSSGFASAMRHVGWLSGESGDLTFPNFDRHNGESAKKRAVEQRKKQYQRDKSRDKCPQDKGTNVPQNQGQERDQRREEKSREDINTKEENWTAVLPFDSEAFKETWKKWVQHRHEIKKPMKPTQIQTLLAEMRELGESESIARMMQSISNGWQGLFEVKKSSQKSESRPHRKEETIEIPVL